MKVVNEEYLRVAVFGLEDALVSTTGLITGIASSGIEHKYILLSVIVAVCVEAISMGSGEYISQETSHQIRPKRHRDNLFLGALVMVISYFVGGVIPTLPLLVGKSYVYWHSIIAGFVGLLALGYLKGRLTKRSTSKSALEVLIVGGIAALAGILVGITLKL